MGVCKTNSTCSPSRFSFSGTSGTAESTGAKRGRRAGVLAITMERGADTPIGDVRFKIGSLGSMLEAETKERSDSDDSDSVAILNGVCGSERRGATVPGAA